MAGHFTSIFWTVSTMASSFMTTPEAKNIHVAFHYLQDFWKFYSYLNDMPFWLKAAWCLAAACLFLAYYDIKVGRLSLRPNASFTPVAVRPLRIFLRQMIVVSVILFSGVSYGIETCLGQIIVLLFRDRYYFFGGFLLLSSVSISTLISYYEI